MKQSLHVVASVLALSTAVAPGDVCRACNTPVYRYAMYNWEAARYPVFWLHEGPAKSADEAAPLLRAASEAGGESANVEYFDVDATVPKQMAGLPDEVKKAWKEREKHAQALHLAFTPWGASLFRGQLDAKHVAAMLRSPLRKRIGELLAEGNAVVFLVLAPPSEEAARKVEQLIDRVAENARSGEIVAPATEGASAAGGESSGGPQAGRSHGPRVARVTLSRNDPVEEWLLKTLLSMEDDSQEFANEAMVFPIYGRGRALPPFIGKGIHEENLAECVGFLSGACSCTIKEQSPGADLLLAWDWQATAQRLAAEDEESDGGQVSYREVSMPTSAAPSAGGAQSGAKPAAAAPIASQAKPTAVPSGAMSAGKPSPQAVQPDSPLGGKTPPFVRRSMQAYAAAAAVAACLVLAIGFYWMRRQSLGRQS